jgi:hypothetical protein
MILLVTNSFKAEECGREIAKTISLPVQVASNPREALKLVRAGHFAALIIDQQLQESYAGEIEPMLLEIGTAIPLFINLAISGTQRVVHELRTALHRGERERLVASRSAEEKLRNELKDTVTALLLSCEMALQATIPASDVLPPGVQAKLRSVDGLARELVRKIGLN